MRRIASLLTCILVAGSALAPASADSGGRTDGDDTPGPLDIAQIAHRHRNGEPDSFIHEITMHERWASRILLSGNRSARDITVTFNIRDEDGYSCTGCQSEREVIIDFRRERGLVASLYNHLDSLPERLARLKVWRPTERTVAFSVRKRQLQRGAYSSYEWGVEAVYETQGDETCPLNHACRDLAPNGRYDLLRHDL